MPASAEELRRIYGFEFPKDFFDLWEFARARLPHDPRHALDAVGMTLVGPYDFLAGRFDRARPAENLLLHWRFRRDPPEFFTVLSGSEEGQHWGYYLDDPAQPPGWICSYAEPEGYEFSIDGATVFDAVRRRLELCLQSAEEDPGRRDETTTRWRGEEETSFSFDASGIDRLRRELMKRATGDRRETGRAYREKHNFSAARRRAVTARTSEGMGIRVPPKSFRPPRMAEDEVWKRLSDRNPDPVAREARAALKEGFAGTALWLAKELWAREFEQAALEIMIECYGKLGRPLLQKVARLQREHPDRPTVDLLAARL
jgi:hypothetical protein